MVLLGQLHNRQEVDLVFACNKQVVIVVVVIIIVVVVVVVIVVIIIIIIIKVERSKVMIFAVTYVLSLICSYVLCMSGTI
jgi:hypothetical protein